MRILAPLIVLILNFACAQEAVAEYFFTKIADATPTLAIETWQMNNAGTVVLTATMNPNEPALTTGVLLIGDGISLATLVDTKRDNLSFVQLGGINDAGQVAYTEVRPNYTGIVVTSEGSKTTIVDSTGPLFNTYLSQINNQGTVAFHATDTRSGLEGIYKVTPHSVPQLLYDNSGPYTEFYLADFNDSDVVAMRGFLSGNRVRLVLGNGGPLTVITGLEPPELNALPEDFALNNANTIAFGANTNYGTHGIHIGDANSITRVVHNNGPPFANLDNPSLNNKGQVAFGASLSDGTSGVFTGPDPVRDKVLTTGHTIGEKQVQTISHTPTVINDVGQIAFKAFHADGTNTLYRADPYKVPNIPTRLNSRLLPQKPGSKNLVIVVPGWGEEAAWANEMRDAIQEHNHNEHMAGRLNENEWEVIAYESIDGMNPYDALANANSLGVVEGQIIGGRQYQHVHLIGYSAGAGLVTYAARQIKRVSSSTSVHTTFLDAFAPDITDLLYGTASNWSDHYFNHGDSGWLDWTELKLKNSHNVNVTGLDPTPTPLQPALGHAWPREFYHESIFRDDPYALGYGFKLSREGGKWNPGDYPTGNDPVLLYALPIPEPPERILETKIHYVNFGGGRLAISETGTVNLAASSFSVETGSAVWLVQGLELSDPISFLSFDLDFTGEAGSEGLLSVFLDNQLIGKVDERFVLDDVQTQHFSFAEVEAGFHTLAFRLDPFTEIQSSAKIDNVGLGSIEVIPEPESIVLVFIGTLILVLYCRLKNPKKVAAGN